MADLRYTIPLPPVTKKNSQQILTNRKTGRPFIMPSKQYKSYEAAAGMHLRPRPVVPLDYPLCVTCLFYLPTRRRGDLTNYLEAVDDILVHAGILADDHYGIIASHDGSRCFYDKQNPRTEIIISRFPESQTSIFERKEAPK